jgi:hypothetical protein
LKPVFIITIVAVAMIGMGVIPVHGEVLEKQADAAILVMIDDLEFLFYTSGYQMQDPHIFFSDGDGNTIHRYHEDATMELLFNSMDVGIEDQCYVFPKSTGYPSDHFCVNDDYSLKYFINGKPVSGILDYIIQDNDRILIIFGNETDKQIQEYFSQLNSIKIKSSDAEIRVAEARAEAEDREAKAEAAAIGAAEARAKIMAQAEESTLPDPSSEAFVEMVRGISFAEEKRITETVTNFLIIVIVIAIMIISLVVILIKRKNKKSTTSQRSTTSPYSPPNPPPSPSGNTESSTIFFYECPKCQSGDIENNPDGSVNCPDCGYRG